VSRVAAIHHSLGHVDAGPSYAGAFGHVYHTTDRSTVNADPNLQARVVLERAGNLHRTLRRFLREGPDGVATDHRTCERIGSLACDARFPFALALWLLLAKIAC
jgi:hypothetical protein